MTTLTTEDLFYPTTALAELIEAVRLTKNENIQALAFEKMTLLVGTVLSLNDHAPEVMTALGKALPLRKTTEGDIDMDEKLVGKIAETYEAAMRRWPQHTPASMIADSLSISVFDPCNETRQAARNGLSAVAEATKNTTNAAWAQKTNAQFARVFEALEKDVQTVGDTFCKRELIVTKQILDPLLATPNTPSKKNGHVAKPKDCSRR